MDIVLKERFTILCFQLDLLVMLAIRLGNGLRVRLELDSQLTVSPRSLTNKLIPVSERCRSWSTGHAQYTYMYLLFSYLFTLKPQL